ncbi:MAG: NAD(P)/FAD-dependent oxidoreductase [Rhodothalassiaceae bacterium]
MKTGEEGGDWPRIAILGGGFAGVLMAIRLRKAGIGRFTLFEKSPQLGGTWHDNRYPGAGCDVPSHLYCYSFAPKADWSRKYASQPEILAYIEDCARQFDILPHCRLGCEIVSARWDEEARIWHLVTATGETQECDFLISGLGQLNRPYMPDIPGLADFAGDVFHSARWPGDFDPKGRRIAVIGSGASAIQIVPEIAKAAAHLTLFQRSPNWIIPRRDRAYGAHEIWAFRHLPFWRRLYRAYIYWLLESRFIAFRKDSLLTGLIEWQARRHLRQQIPDAALRTRLTPDYPAGCKRILISDDFYPALNAANVRLKTAGIAHIEKDAILTDEGERIAVDTLVFATGFRTHDFVAPLEVAGRDGLPLAERWREGAEAHFGMAVDGFPNFLLLYGPNTNLGHNSIIFMLEQQTGWALNLIGEMRRRGLRRMEVDAQALKAHNDRVSAELDRLVWSAGCGSWYKTESGRIVNNWPGSTLAYRRCLRRLRLADFHLD